MYVTWCEAFIDSTKVRDVSEKVMELTGGGAAGVIGKKAIGLLTTKGQRY